METLSGTVVRTEHGAQPVSFFVVNPSDVIQRRHMQGRFYEEEELDIIGRWFTPGGGSF